MELNTIKTTIVAIIFEILAYFKPLGDEIFLLSMIFLVNFLAGLIADIVVNHDHFQFRKAWRCIVELTTFFAMVVFIFIFGEKKGWNVGALQCVSFLTYVICWFYSQNILKNLKSLFKPDTDAHKVISFLYWLVSIEFVKKIPYLKDWVENEKHEDTD